jgi:hypothetical protein
LATALKEPAFFLICVDLPADFLVWGADPTQLPQLFETGPLYNRPVSQKDRNFDE